MMSKKAKYFFLFLSLIVGMCGGFLYWTISDLPNIRLLEEYAPIESSLVYSSDGEVLAELYLERRMFIPSYQIPDHVKKAFISVEDVRFYRHPGVDFFGIARAVWHDIQAGGIVEGGSTITQQLARMLFLKPEKNFGRKIKEVALSIRIERRYTKEEILGMYLNQAYFGARAYGIEAASRTYFGKSTKELTIAEAAMLAAMPKAPSVYSPFRDPQKARERRALVLRNMWKEGLISEVQHRQAEKEPLPTSRHFRKYEAPYFIETLRQTLETRYGDVLYRSGYKIYSTIDARMQRLAEEAVKNGIAAVEKRTKPGVEAALVAMDVRNGHIKALVGGSNFWKNQYNRATQALRQPGSAFKPFIYAAAIEGGMRAHDAVLDAPISFAGSRAGQAWSPRNYDGEYYGNVTLRRAMAKSLNAATIRLASHIGVETIIEMARRLGITGKLDPYLTIAIGSADVTVMEMVTAYATFATGQRPLPLSYERILNRDGIAIEEKSPLFTEVFSVEDVEEMKILLKAVVEEGTAMRAREIGRPAFGKTGTTNDYTDAWFVGFDERFVVGVWVGRDDHTPIGTKETGSQAALPIWIEFMKKAPPQIPWDQNP